MPRSLRPTTLAPLLALLAACAATESRTVESVPGFDTHDELFPPATRALSLPAADAGATYARLVDELVAATGIRLSIDEPTRSVLDHEPLALSTAVNVPPDEVYPFAEGLLADRGFLLRALYGGRTSLFALTSGVRPTLSGKVDAVVLPPEEAAAFCRRHPLLLVSTRLDCPHLDARQVSTSLRGLLTDTNTQTLLATDPHGMWVTGTGRIVAQLAELVRLADASAAESEEQPAEPVVRPGEGR